MIRNEEELLIWLEYLEKKLDTYDYHIFTQIMQYKNNQIIDATIEGARFSRDLVGAVRKAGL